MKITKFIILILITSTVSIAQDTLKLSSYMGNLRIIEASIANNSYEFLFDTGGGETLLSPDILKRIGKITYAQTIGLRMNGERVIYQRCDSINMIIGHNAFSHDYVGVFDIMKLLPKELPRIEGVISLKTFDSKQITLDLSNDQIIIETTKSFKRKIKKITLIKSVFANGLDGHQLNIFLPIDNNNRTYWFLLDSGNLNSVLLSKTTASEWNLKDDLMTGRVDYVGRNIMLGTKTITTDLTSLDLIYDGVLNFETISKFKFYIDFRSNKVWFE